LVYQQARLKNNFAGKTGELTMFFFIPGSNSSFRFRRDNFRLTYHQT
jgi:hypothetical protein